MKIWKLIPAAILAAGAAAAVPAVASPAPASGPALPEHA